MAKIGELDTDSEDRPLSDPIPKILRVCVTENPFDDILPRKNATKELPKSEPKIEQVKPISRLNVKNTNLISFADEDEYGDEIPLPKSKITSMGAQSNVNPNSKLEKDHEANI